jgi:hypothetical protein
VKLCEGTYKGITVDWNKVAEQMEGSRSKRQCLRRWQEIKINEANQASVGIRSFV